MIKLIIADDEPLIQVGLKSMIDWKKLDIEICGTASNGDNAWKLIQEYQPELVITDIQMPCSSGLELGKRCRDELGPLPVFIILTGYEDFQYAREALSFQAVDYLVKIDLTPESLTASVKKALEQIRLFQSRNSSTNESTQSLILFQERFYIRLLNNLFESREQFLLQAEEFHIKLDAAGYVAASIQFFPNTCVENIPFQSYDQTLQMFQELISKYISCQIIALDTRYLAAIFCIDKLHLENWKSYVKSALESTLSMLHNYYNVTFLTSIGGIKTDPLDLSSSYYDSKQITEYVSDKQPLLFWDELPNISTLRNVFNLSLFRDDIRRAFEEVDEDSLKDIMENITEILSTEHVPFAQALDAASSILHLSITLLPDGNEIVSEIFKSQPDSYCSLYRQKTVPSIMDWLHQLEVGLYDSFAKYKREHKNSLTALCCQYIKEHIHERIYLQDIADNFGISPNYLSQIFKKNMDIGISEYITVQKITESKQLLKETNLKIYEISDKLGFENSFYFSKVFKKITGLSPKDYRNV